MKFIDIHCHLDFKEYDSDRDEVIARTKAEDIGIMNVGVDLVTSEKVILLTRQYQDMWAIVGIHPVDSKEAAGSVDFLKLSKLAQHPKVVAIGECGLDYFHSTPEDFERQKEVFIEHIKIANEVGKPLMLHVRNGTENLGAYRDAILLLTQYAKVRANFHFFVGTMEDLKLILDINGTVSFTGVVTFARSYDEIIKFVPIDRIMSETDAPFVAPAPYRGKRNEPLFIKEIVASLTSVRGETIEKLSTQIIDNAKKMFGI